MQQKKPPQHVQGPANAPMASNITSQTFTNQNYQNLVSSMQFNQSQMLPQPPVQQQKPNVPKANDMAHIPGFATKQSGK
jgi:hypothetical protein